MVSSYILLIVTLRSWATSNILDRRPWSMSPLTYHSAIACITSWRIDADWPCVKWKYNSYWDDFFTSYNKERQYQVTIAKNLISMWSLRFCSANAVIVWWQQMPGNCSNGEKAFTPIIRLVSISINNQNRSLNTFQFCNEV